VLVGLLQISSWIRRLLAPSPPPPFPTGVIPKRDTNEAGLVLNSPSPYGFPKAHFFVPRPEDLKWFVEWSEANPAIADANELPTYKRKLLYESWYDADPQSFLVMQRKQTVNDIWETYALSIILTLPKETVYRLKDHQLSIIDLRAEHLQFLAGERKGRYLLFDTLIIDPHSRDKYSDFKRWHSLIHFARFEPPATNREISVLIEPDNPQLKKSLNNPKKYEVREHFELIGGHRVHEFVFPVSGMPAPKLKAFEQYWQQIHTERWDIQVGPH